MPLKLCSIFINTENKINKLQQFCLNASAIWKAFECKDYKTNIKSIYFVVGLATFIQALFAALFYSSWC